jgi:hypothetical protein
MLVFPQAVVPLGSNKVATSGVFNRIIRVLACQTHHCLRKRRGREQLQRSQKVREGGQGRNAFSLGCLAGVDYCDV